MTSPSDFDLKGTVKDLTGQAKQTIDDAAQRAQNAATQVGAVWRQLVKGHRQVSSEPAVYDPCLGRDDGFRSRRIVEVVNDKRAIANSGSGHRFSTR